MSEQNDSSDRDETTGNAHADEDDAPTEPRDSEEGQRQADESQDESMDAGTERDEREDHPDADAGEADTHGSTEPVGQRETAPQSDFTTRQVGIGVAVLAVGLLVVFALPLLLA